MSKSLKALLKYGIPTVIGVIVSCIYISSVGGFSALGDMNQKELYMVLCDAVTLPGLMLFFLGALVVLANAGAFDGLGYVLSTAVKMLIPGRALSMESYRDYVTRKREEGNRGYGFLMIVGVGFLAVAFVFLYLYFQC